MTHVVCLSRAPRRPGPACRRALAAARATGGRLTVLTSPRRQDPSRWKVTVTDTPSAGQVWRVSNQETLPFADDETASWGVDTEVRMLTPRSWSEDPAAAFPRDTGLVVKVAARRLSHPGHASADIDLLRSLDSSLWLVSPLRPEGPRGPVLAGVSLDPETAGLDQAVLRMAALVADIEELPLCIVHGWGLIGESILTCPVGGIGRSRARGVLRRIRREHEALLESLLSRAGIGSETPRLLVKGTAPDSIRDALRQTEAQALIVGYRGRSGLARWIQPNLAEEFVGTPGLSLVAVREGAP